MSTSLKVVSMAASCVAATRRSAILRRSGDIFLRVSRTPCEIAGFTGATNSAGPGEGAGPVAGTTGDGLSDASMMSLFITRPSLPLPEILTVSTPVSSADLRAAGESVATGSTFASTGASVDTMESTASAGATSTSGMSAFFSTGASTALSSIEAMIWPMSTSSSTST